MSSALDRCEVHNTEQHFGVAWGLCHLAQRQAMPFPLLSSIAPHGRRTRTLASSTAPNPGNGNGRSVSLTHVCVRLAKIDRYFARFAKANQAFLCPTL